MSSIIEVYKTYFFKKHERCNIFSKKKVNLYDRKTLKNYLVKKCFYVIEEYKKDNIEKKKCDLYFYVLVYIDAILFKLLYVVMLGLRNFL